MDPKHRDRIAFMRICSGEFYEIPITTTWGRNEVWNFRIYCFMAAKKEVIDEVTRETLLVCTIPAILKLAIPCRREKHYILKAFPAFTWAIQVRQQYRPLKTKQLNKGLDQLMDEGVLHSCLLVRKEDAKSLVRLVRFSLR